ncbi:hypothetical protein EG329_005044 [Mollisiaceae sp. DMI_Dod_QoI]|nr:hypothetical protein EG329_005044 [Helotiales sp. DMI_Dod_QoI]
MARTGPPPRKRSPSGMDSSEGQDFVVLGDNDIDDYNEDGILPQLPEVISKIQEWLQPTDYLAESSEYNKHLNSHVPGTGLWIQETEAYRLWHNSPDHGSLWTKAIAGAGKSVFAAMIAAKLAHDEKVPVLSFFFRQIIDTNHDPQSLIRDWISMILKHSPPLQAKMKKYMDDRRAIHNISASEFWQDILHTLASLPKVYCVVDALDEMDIDKQDFFKDLIDLGKRKPSSIKLLMTSRPLPRIEAFLKDPSILQVRLEQLKVDEDIALYVDYRLDRRSEMNFELRSAVKQAIGLKAQGSFLYARLMMDELLDHMRQMVPDIKYIQRSLDWLPLTLEDMYNGMLLDHSLRSRVPQDLQLTILRWVTHSSRPLRLLELAAMLDSLSQTGKAGKDTKSVVRAACGPLLEILEDETVSVIHHSFTEFLTDLGRSSRPALDGLHAQFPVIDSEDAHKLMGLTCLRYLTSGCLKDWKLEETRKQTQQGIKLRHSFLDYAMHNWYVHIRKARPLGELVLADLDEFMKTDNYAFQAWVDMTWSITKNRAKLSPLHVAAWAGMSVYVKHILDLGVESNGRDNRERTPLSWASAQGHTKVVSLLLEKISEPDLDDSNGLKPLHYAARANHHAVVKLLLAQGVSPLTGKTKDPGRRCGNARSTIGDHPLMYASQSGCTEAVREMVPYLEVKDLHDALCWAASSGKTQLVDLLLALPGVSAEPPEHSDTPLFLASAGLHYHIMKALLEKGADPNSRSTNYRRNGGTITLYNVAEQKDRGPTPLHAVCGLNGPHNHSRESDSENMKRCLRILLDAGSNVNAVDRTGWTPLHQAISLRKYSQPAESLPGVLMLLLDNGADPTIQDDFGDTPLHLVSLRQDSASIIDLLLSKGCSLDVRRSKDGRTPLHTMMDDAHAIDIKPLLPYVKDWNVRDSHGDTPLHIFLSSSFHPKAALQDLLDAGADLSCKNKDGEAPIHSLREIGHGPGTSIIPTLLAAGASLETKDSEGRTFLLRLLRGNLFNAQKQLQGLFELGAKIDACDYNGDGVLHLICKKYHDVDLVQALVAAGANPLSTNHAGNSLLHEVLGSYTGHLERSIRLVNLLLDIGVPAGARNNHGQTPFHRACRLHAQYMYSGMSDLVEEILKTKLGAFINAEDNDGIRPIHLAATTSEFLVARLILHGADATAVTNDDMTLLHIAARARQSNVIGLLFEHFSKVGRSDILHLRDSIGRTALHYACRSGHPESVALLLKAGASPNVVDNKNRAPLHACAEFEHDIMQQSIDLERPNPLKSSARDIFDPQRQQQHQQQRRAMWVPISTEKETFRIREIVRLLIDYGSAVTFPHVGPVHSPSPIQLAIAESCAEMVDELAPHMEKVYGTAKAESQLYPYPSTLPFQQRYLINSTKPVVLKCDFEKDPSSLCNQLLALKQHKAIEELPAMGANFSPRPGSKNDFLTILAQYGYVSMFEKLGGSIQTPGWVNGIDSPTQNLDELVRPYLLTAAHRELPNLDMIKLLVERFGADINIQPNIAVYQTGRGHKYPPGNSALHILARGTHWWQTEALAYLLAKGANTELKNEKGRTPLDIAVSCDRGYPSYRRRETAKILLEHGADPNSVDENGLTCLNKAMHDIELVRLLIKYGADISIGDQSVLFSAIAAQDVTAVAAILESGADCNAKPKPVDRSKLPNHRHNIKVYDSELYPIHYAASQKFNTAKTRESSIKIIKLLLDNGANPYLQLGDDSTIIHDIFQSGGMLQPFLELPNLDLELRDPNGRTLLLAACQSKAGSTTPTMLPPSTHTSYKSPEEHAKKREEMTADDPSPSFAVYDRGGDLLAVDNEGNNALHLLIQTTPHNNEQFKKTFRTFIDKAPSLISQKNAKGDGPFHVAISNSKIWAAETLMEVGADPLSKDGQGNTALHYLAPRLCLDIPENEWIPRFQKFLSLGLSINEKNNVGETPVFRYFESGQVRMAGSSNFPRKYISLLEEAGADLFARNEEGEGVLHVVAKKKQNEIITHLAKSNVVDTFRFLMEKGLDPMVEDNNQRTALDVAAAYGNDAVLALFKRDKAQVVLPKKEKVGSLYLW